MSETSGRCLCGAVTYSYEGEPLWRVHCHCESCRRNCSAPFTTWFGVADGKWRWTGEAPKLFNSKGGRRQFCGTCGTPMAYAADRFPGEIHFYAASLDDSSGFVPERHVFHGERVPWVELADHLPRRE